MKKSDFLLQIVTVTLSVTHLSATKLKWDPYFNQNRIEELIDTPEKAVSVVLENGRLNQVPPDRVVNSVRHVVCAPYVTACHSTMKWFWG